MINKKWKKDASENAVNALMRVGGTAVASIVLKKVTDASFTSKSNVNQTIGNVASPLVALAALAGDLFLESPTLRAVCQGMYAYAIPKTVATIAPAIGSYMGLSGAPVILNGASPIMNGAIMNGTPAITSGSVMTQVANDAASAYRAPSAEVQADRLAGSMISN